MKTQSAAKTVRAKQKVFKPHDKPACGSHGRSQDQVDILLGKYRQKYPNIDEEIILQYFQYVTKKQACNGLNYGVFDDWWTKYFPQAAAAKFIDLDDNELISLNDLANQKIKKAIFEALAEYDKLHRRECFCRTQISESQFDNKSFSQISKIVEDPDGIWRYLTDTPIGWAVLHRLGFPKITEAQFLEGLKQIPIGWEERFKNHQRKGCHVRKDRILTYLATHEPEDIERTQRGAGMFRGGILDPRLRAIVPLYPFKGEDQNTASSDSKKRHYRKMVSILADNNRKFMRSDDFKNFLKEDLEEVSQCPDLLSFDKGKLEARLSKLPEHSVTRCQILPIPMTTWAKLAPGVRIQVPTGHNGQINLRTIVDDNGDKIRAYWEVQRCHNVLFCAECNYKYMSKKRADIIEGIENLKEDYPNLQFVFATFTFPHKGRSSLTIKMELLRYAQCLFRSSRWYSKFRNQYRLLGYIRALEATFSLINWWHPHFHYVWLFDKEDEFTQSEIDEMTKSVTDYWVHCCIAKKLVEDTPENRQNMKEHAVKLEFSAKDVRLWGYIAKDDPLRKACCHDFVSLEKSANELTNPANAKESKLAGHISQFEVLRKATDMSLDLEAERRSLTARGEKKVVVQKGAFGLTWKGEVPVHEYTTEEVRSLYRKAWTQFLCAMKGRSAIQWSQNLREMCGLSEEEAEEGEPVAGFLKDDKELLNAHHLQTSILSNIERNGGQLSDKFANFLKKKGINFFCKPSNTESGPEELESWIWSSYKGSIENCKREYENYKKNWDNYKKNWESGNYAFFADKVLKFDDEDDACMMQKLFDNALDHESEVSESILDNESEMLERLLGKTDLENHVKYISAFVNYFREHQSDYQSDEYLGALDLLVNRYHEYSEEDDFSLWKIGSGYEYSYERYDLLEEEINSTYRQCMKRWAHEIECNMYEDIEGADFESVMLYENERQYAVKVFQKLEKKQKTVVEHQQLELLEA